MALDPIMVVETREWLRRSANDIRAAEIDLAASPPLLEDALFHCQQAAEKALKAFLTFHKQPFRKTHNLEEIGEACLTLDATLQPFVDDAIPLSEYAWAYRYPGPTPPPTPEEADEGFAITSDIYGAILARLPVQVRSEL